MVKISAATEPDHVAAMRAGRGSREVIWAMYSPTRSVIRRLRFQLAEQVMRAFEALGRSFA
jgi:hypothetical protein